MVTQKDLQEDYKEILASGELDKPPKKPFTQKPLAQIIIWVIILTLSLWSIAWLY